MQITEIEAANLTTGRDGIWTDTELRHPRFTVKTFKIWAPLVKEWVTILTKVVYDADDQTYLHRSTATETYAHHAHKPKH